LSRLAAGLATLVGLLLVPLGLAAPTSFVLLPAHLFFTVLTLVAIGADSFLGRPGRVGVWTVLYVLASVCMVVSLEVGFSVRPEGWYALTPIVPWAGAVLWGWTVPVAGLVAFEIARLRRRRLSKLAVARRRAMRTG
jgi:hypothetical protein